MIISLMCLAHTFLRLGSGVGSTGNDYSSAPPPSKPDGGESGSNGVNERGVDVDEDEGAEEEINAITFKGRCTTIILMCDLHHKFFLSFQRNKMYQQTTK